MSVNRLSYLDSARGIAAIMVLIFHSILTFSKESIELSSIAYFFSKYFDLGKIAVIIFFVISGIVIPYSIRGSKIVAIKKFVISRFFRLYPVYWVSVIVGFLLFEGFTQREFLLNLTMLQQFIGVRNIFGLYWTLQIELIFYFLVVIVFVFNKISDEKYLFSISVLFLVISIIVAFFRGMLGLKLPIGLFLSLSLMFFGSYYRHYLLEGNLQIKKYASIYIIFYIIAIPIISKLGYSVDLGHNESWIKYTITYYSGILMFLTLVKFKFSNRYSEYLGRISYSVYLFHPVSIFLIENTIFFKSINGFLKVICVLLLTVIFSHFTFKFIEQSSIDMGKKMKSLIE
ncbi:acyltransferase family protein [Flavobacterium sp. HJJ]|uniref:acyltransferase family protein n=1 Tax=Flavobacterium sp. HJJ TaxID=2783792 RepID=UPI00188B3ED0|nr:acyltransferase [Flavobacterium sp. HJJ]MBF4470434.1 acyltransferase [Flavobacterium sp. HJJ]